MFVQMQIEPFSFPRGDNLEIVNFYSKYLKIFSEPLTNLNQTWHKASLGEGIQVCSNEGPRPFPKADNSEKVQLY